MLPILFRNSFFRECKSKRGFIPLLLFALGRFAYFYMLGLCEYAKGFCIGLQLRGFNFCRSDVFLVIS